MLVLLKCQRQLNRAQQPSSETNTDTTTQTVPKLEFPTVSDTQTQPETQAVQETKTEEPEVKQPVAPLAQTMLSQDSQESKYIKQSLPTRYGVNAPNLDEKTGGLEYAYPIIVPPGRNGFSPDLALQYTSQDHRSGSVVGFGWSINTLYIERVNHTRTRNLFSESYYTSSFDGDLATTSDASIFKAKVENGSFLSYTFQNNTWTVTDKSGLRYIFGPSSATRLDNPSDSTQIFRWMLQEVRDSNNNYVAYTYTKDYGQIYPATITYTGNGVTDGPFTIQFTTEVRPDTSTSSINGFPVYTRYRISRIETQIKSPSLI